ncbi:hypothetical protein AK830_g6665 [Neonectria ditissima]|uniref:Uncharacterized protein n=1 Tax=Neonectria ditissima TaxID=78410 RepID=A0A0P7BHY1_9HYPO|nr:hypothetical protein AK830_g6665 [Neonectria ditissima]
MSNPYPDFYVKPEHIHKGSWTNWNGDQTTGGKITVLKNRAELLMIFIGIFFVFMEAGLWSLVSFGLFVWGRSRNPGRDRDALWHQQQTTLRNAGDDRTVGLTYISLWLAYGRNDRAIMLRTFPTVFVALTSFAIFLIALPFMTAYAMLDNQGVEVLIESPSCGWWKASFADNVVLASTEVTNRTREAIQYADTCYETSQTDAPSDLCDNFLMKRKLDWVGQADACPFEKGMCIGHADFPAFEMRTRLLDSHEHFGMNSPKQGRFALRVTTTCSPLNVKAWSSVEKGPTFGEKVTRVYFGRTASDNYTFYVSSYQAQAGTDYRLGAYHSNTHDQDATAPFTFTPIKQLRRDDGDVSVIFLNNNIIPIAGFNGPCRDPFFSATQQETGTRGWYLPDDPITAIGCVDQYEFHNPLTNDWSRKTGLLKLGTDLTKDSGLLWRQVAAMNSFRWALGEVGPTGRQAAVVGPDALKAKKFPGVFNGFQNPLPNDQWKKEVRYWFNARLAALQLQFIRVSTGPQDSSAMVNILPTAADGASHDVEGFICHSQKIKSGGFKNFHRAGFVALATVGGLMIVVPWLFMKFAVHWGGRRKNALALEWISYGQLQMLRMASEGVGVEGWRNCDGEIPYLPLEQSIASVDAEMMIDGRPHPRLRHRLEPPGDTEMPGDQSTEVEAEVETDESQRNSDESRRNSDQVSVIRPEDGSSLAMVTLDTRESQESLAQILPRRTTS